MSAWWVEMKQISRYVLDSYINDFDIFGDSHLKILPSVITYRHFCGVQRIKFVFPCVLPVKFDSLKYSIQLRHTFTRVC